ncbi:hypothetical protein [Tenacibaculum halocynthiae]|uniref:hypothetical protein n=1 Tax=Tenacibaculum halocynthiae TaxID=1254437 RepID=UPI003D65878B
MKELKITSVFILFILILSCSTDNTEELTEWRCGTHNGKELWTGPKGGCYYKNSNGNKTYVDRSECDC